jgi:hypothetical protein
LSDYTWRLSPCQDKSQRGSVQWVELVEQNCSAESDKIGRQIHDIDFQVVWVAN